MCHIGAYLLGDTSGTVEKHGRYLLREIAELGNEFGCYSFANFFL